LKKGFIGAYHLGALRGPAASLNFVDEEIGGAETKLDAVFYTSSFQAGIDEFIVPYLRKIPLPVSVCLSDRVKRISDTYAVAHVNETWRVFESYIPPGWEDDENLAEVWRLKRFLIDLLDGMSVGASMLSSRGVPDVTRIKSHVPRDLFIPIFKLVSAIVGLELHSLIPRETISNESLEKLDNILSSALFSEYTAAHSLLDDSTVATESVIASITKTAKKLLVHRKDLLLGSKSAVSILQLSPKLVDSTLAKLPGNLGEMAATLGLGLLTSGRRIVIYNLGDYLSKMAPYPRG